MSGVPPHTACQGGLLMGRLMPVECQHGHVIDYGDFGDDNEPYGGATPCPQCESGRTTYHGARDVDDAMRIAQAAIRYCAARDTFLKSTSRAEARKALDNALEVLMVQAGFDDEPLRLELGHRHE